MIVQMVMIICFGNNKCRLGIRFHNRQPNIKSHLMSFTLYYIISVLKAQKLINVHKDCKTKSINSNSVSGVGNRKKENLLSIFCQM